jgi:hypothetical protein
MGTWELTEDELDKLASRARYAFAIHRMQSLSPGSKVAPWGKLSYGERHAWMNAISETLIELDIMGKTKDTIVIDYD